MVESTLEALKKNLRRQYMSLITLLVSVSISLVIPLLISRNNINIDLIYFFRRLKYASGRF
jgi:hypothetical protein